MKHPTGYAKPRRLAAPKKKVRLNLQRRPKPEPEEELGTEKKSNFWKWVALVALLHVLAIGVVYLIFESSATPKPPEQFISLLPEGDVVKGTPGAQQAHKLGPTTAASPVHHHAAPPPPAPAAAIKPKPVIPPTAAVQPPAPSVSALDKPAPKPPPKPVQPKPPKIKVDLNLADAPPAPDQPKPKHHPKKLVAKPDDDSEDEAPDSAGLSRDQIAMRLGEKLDPGGIRDAVKSGTSGSVNAHPNSFADFYASIRDQVMSQWQSPNLADETAVNPIVQIHVEKDGRVPPESVHLVQSSGNPSYDDSALSAAKNLGFLHEPLPDGCPPDIPITFKLTR